MIMCFKGFRSFRDKSKKKVIAGGGQGKTAPELRKRSSSADSRPKRAAKSTGSLPSQRSIPELYKEREQNLRVFSLLELAEATNRFSRLLKIGEGGFGSVYKGSIDSENGGPPTIVAIKKLNTRGFQGHKQWVTEVQFLGVLHHPNLVKLLGYCATDGERGIQRLLVYEYMPNKSLEDHLFNHTVPVIPWTTRLNIILGAAEGMAYLHEGSENQVIYRDFKSSNVLLDKDFNAKLSDFGLAREGPTGDRTHVSTAPVGTQGYAAPEYIETGQLSIKSDVYSFGVVLYEILTGRRTLERDLPSDQQKLLHWIKQYPVDSNRFQMIMDKHLKHAYNLKTARNIAKLADQCLSKNPRDRPSMREVVEILKQALEESQSRSNAHPSSSQPTQA